MTRAELRCGGLVALAIIIAGCHTYTPVTTPVPGTTVRVRLPITNAAANRNAAPQTVSVEGIVVEAGDTLVLATTNRQEYGAFREIIQFDTIRLGPDQVYSVERSDFSTKKSIGLGLVLTGGAALLAAAAFGGLGGDDAPIPGGPPPPMPTVVVSNSFIAGILGLFGGG